MDETDGTCDHAMRGWCFFVCCVLCCVVVLCPFCALSLESCCRNPTESTIGEEEKIFRPSTPSRQKVNVTFYADQQSS